MILIVFIEGTTSSFIFPYSGILLHLFSVGREHVDPSCYQPTLHHVISFDTDLVNNRIIYSMKQYLPNSVVIERDRSYIDFYRVY